MSNISQNRRQTGTLFTNTLSIPEIPLAVHQAVYMVEFLAGAAWIIRRRPTR
jgi:hypothetical protein